MNSLWSRISLQQSSFWKSEIALQLRPSEMEQDERKKLIHEIRNQEPSLLIETELKYEILWALWDHSTIEAAKQIFWNNWKWNTYSICPSMSILNKRYTWTNGTTYEEKKEHKEPSAEELITMIPAIVFPKNKLTIGIELIEHIRKCTLNEIATLQILLSLHFLFHEKPPHNPWRNMRLVRFWAESNMELITIKDRHYVPHTLIPTLMLVLMDEIKKVENISEWIKQQIRIAELMYYTNSIHPFCDGNWRTIMLYFNIILSKLWHPCFQISEKDLKINHESLSSNSPNAFVDFYLGKCTKQ